MIRQTSLIVALAGLTAAASASPLTAAKYQPVAGVANNDAFEVTNVSLRTDGNFTFEVTLLEDIDSVNEQGSALNNILTLDINDLAGAPSGSPVSITALAIDATLTAFDPSWLSELQVWFIDSSFDTDAAIIGSPGVGNDNPGSGPFSIARTDLTDALLPDIPLADGVLNLEFAEGFDDAAVDPDGFWSAGSVITIEAVVVPAPASAALLGLGGLAAMRRRR